MLGLRGRTDQMRACDLRVSCTPALGLRHTHSAEQIIHKLREAEVLLSQGRTVAEVWRAGRG